MPNLAVSDFPNSVTTPAGTDLFYISDDLGGGSFESKKITWSNIVAALPSSGDGIYDGSGSLSGVTTVTMGGNNLTFSGGGTIFQGLGTGTNKSFQFRDSAGDARFYIQDNGTTSLQSNIIGQTAVSTFSAKDANDDWSVNMIMDSEEGLFFQTPINSSSSNTGFRVRARTSSFSGVMSGDVSISDTPISDWSTVGLSTTSAFTANLEGSNENGFTVNSRNVTAGNSQIAFGIKQMTGVSSQVESYFTRINQYNYNGGVFTNSTDGIGQTNLLIQNYSNVVRPIFATNHAQGFTYTRTTGALWGRLRQEGLDMYAIENSLVDGIVNSPRFALHTSYDTTSGGSNTPGRLEAYLIHNQSVSGPNPISQIDMTVNGALGLSVWSDGSDSFPEFPEYTVATVPPTGNGGTGMSGVIVVTDEIGGRTLATSDGTNWIRVSDGAVVS